MDGERATIYRPSLPGLALAATAGWQAGPVDTNAFFSDYCQQTYSSEVAVEVAQALEQLATAEEMFEQITRSTTQHALWSDPLEPHRLPRLTSQQSELRAARLLAEQVQEHLLRAMKLAPEDPTLKSLLLAARHFDYLGMKCLYSVEWADYFDQLKVNSDPKLVTLFIGIQINAQDHGMLADLRETIGGLKGLYQQCWIEEATPPYRLESTLARWDAE